jgi:arsenite-transporting ATPase
MGMMGGGGSGSENSLQKIFTKISTLKEETSHLKSVISNPDLTTFVAVCIPEFLSVYETERLVQELTTYDIDIYNIVVNQIVFPEKGSQCGQCLARYKMQKKYLNQIFELYEDFHVVMMGLERSEIRGIDRLQGYADKLLQQKTLPELE